MYSTLGYLQKCEDMATIHKYYVKQMIQYTSVQGEGKKNGQGDGKSRKRKHPDNDDLPKICRYQERCHGNCTFVHLDEEYLRGCKRPYRLCWAHPKCPRKCCRYVHWPPNKPVTKEGDESPGDDQPSKKPPKDPES